VPHFPSPRGEGGGPARLGREGEGAAAPAFVRRTYSTISQVTLTRALNSLSPASTGTAAIFSMA
jgi:hypothetical protein